MIEEIHRVSLPFDSCDVVVKNGTIEKKNITTLKLNSLLQALQQQITTRKITTRNNSIEDLDVTLAIMV
jgi:hypothetical protein